MSKVLAMAPSDIDIEHLYDDLTFPEGKNGRPYVVFNMVSSVDGKVTIAGRSQPVGSKTDHALMRKIRAATDMVLVGAGTLRKENIDFRLPAPLRERRVARGLTPVPVAAVLSPSADLPLNRTFFTSNEFPSVVFTMRRAPAEKIRQLEGLAQVVYVGDADVDLSQLMSVLTTELGVKRLVVEGGPTLNFSLIKAGFADELFWTVAPKVVGGHELTMIQGPELLVERASRLRLVSAYSYENEIYLRYLL